MKKKTVAAMLVMCMALSATACGGSDTKETTGFSHSFAFAKIFYGTVGEMRG